MIVAAHQPSYLPWLGYLDKMAKADLFVVMDDLPYEPQNFHSRQRMKLSGGGGWVTVPLEGGGSSDLILDQRIDNSGPPKQHWQRRTWATLETHYRRAPGFDRYADELRDVYMRPWTRLIDLDLHMLELARSWLGIEVAVVRSSTLRLRGDLTARLIQMCQEVGARAYLSGTGNSTTALDAERFGRAGLGVIWQHFDHPVYPQRYPERAFTPNLGFLDLMFNCAEISRDVLLGSGHPIHAKAA